MEVKNKRRGSLLLVLMFGTLMAVVMLGMMTLATDLYTSGRESANIYADIQDYRATCELACYQYINDMCAILVEKDLNAGWVEAGHEVVDGAVFTQALELIVDELKAADGSSMWKKSTALEAIAGCGVLDPSVLTSLVAKLSVQNVREVFILQLPSGLSLEFDPETSFVSRDSAYLSVKPFIVEITFGMRGETTVERFTVSGLNLAVSIDEDTDIATMFITEGPEGVQIVRVY